MLKFNANVLLCKKQWLNHESIAQNLNTVAVWVIGTEA